MGLKENAAALAGEPLPGTQVADEPEFKAAPNLEEPDLGDLSQDPEKVSAIAAWSRVMGETRAISKDREFKGGKSGNFMFRGVDDALNAFGPACRKHGVVIMPSKTTCEYRDIPTSGGGVRRECTATVVFRIYGPNGDHFDAETVGEAADSAGRASTKAQALALRTLLLTGGLVPTEDRDADADHFERGEAHVRPAASYMEEVFAPGTSKARLQQIYKELVSTRIATALVRNEIGEDEEIGQLVIRLGKERAKSGGHIGHDPGGFDERCPECKAKQAEHSAVDRELAGVS
jgi:hypothetical protein